MHPIVIDDFNFKPDNLQLAKNLKIKLGSLYDTELKRLTKEAIEVAKPKAMYTIASIEKSSHKTLYLNGKPFTSQILCTNLTDVHRAFPYLATCGTELNEWKNKIKDAFNGYLADVITSQALRLAIDGLYSHLRQMYGLEKTATMNPGSLEDWPLEAQPDLFALLGDPKEAIGVYLTESLLMVPRQSVSGILFETETNFVNCQLCPRTKCPNRRAPFDKDLADQHLK